MHEEIDRYFERMLAERNLRLECDTYTESEEPISEIQYIKVLGNFCEDKNGLELMSTKYRIISVNDSDKTYQCIYGDAYYWQKTKDWVKSHYAYICTQDKTEDEQELLRKYALAYCLAMSCNDYLASLFKGPNMTKLEEVEEVEDVEINAELVMQTVLSLSRCLLEYMERIAVRLGTKKDIYLHGFPEE